MKNTEKYNKTREILKELNDCIWKMFSKKEAVGIFQWIRYSQWLR